MCTKILLIKKVMEEKIVASTALEKYEYYFVQYTLGEMDYHSSQTLKFL